MSETDYSSYDRDGLLRMLRNRDRQAVMSREIWIKAATHRHRKGGEYVLIGYGKMQAKEWIEEGKWLGERVGYEYQSVDMREVAIYRSVKDGALWVRPREEFEDGRFTALEAARSPS